MHLLWLNWVTLNANDAEVRREMTRTMWWDVDIFLLKKKPNDGQRHISQLNSYCNHSWQQRVLLYEDSLVCNCKQCTVNTRIQLHRLLQLEQDARSEQLDRWCPTVMRPPPPRPLPQRNLAPAMDGMAPQTRMAQSQSPIVYIYV